MFLQEIGKVSFRAHFPRDYPRTPPTLLLTEELIHPNWQFPARGLQVPHLTKEGWDSSMTISKVREGEARTHAARSGAAVEIWSGLVWSGSVLCCAVLCCGVSRFGYM